MDKHIRKAETPDGQLVLPWWTRRASSVWCLHGPDSTIEGAIESNPLRNLSRRACICYLESYLKLSDHILDIKSPTTSAIPSLRQEVIITTITCRGESTVGHVRSTQRVPNPPPTCQRRPGVSPAPTGDGRRPRRSRPS